MVIKRTGTRHPGRPASGAHLGATTLNLDRDLLDKYADICVQEGVSLSEGVRNLMSEKIEKKVEGKTTFNTLNLPYHEELNRMKSLTLALNRFMKGIELSDLAEQTIRSGHDPHKLVANMNRFKDRFARLMDKKEQDRIPIWELERWDQE